MWMKIVSCLLFLIIFHYNDYVRGDTEYNVQPLRGIQISKNITLHRNGYGRFLGLLSFFKGEFSYSFLQVCNFTN